MKNRKKILSIILADTLIISTMLSGCSQLIADRQNNKEETATEEEIDLGIESASEEKSSEIEEIEETEEAVETKNVEDEDYGVQNELSKVQFNLKTDKRYDKTSNKILVTMDSQEVEIISDVNPTLQDAVSKWSGGEDLSEGYDLDAIIKDAKEHYDSLDDDSKEYFQPYESTSANEITRNDGRVLSIKNYYYYYEGGAHGNYGYAGANFDVNTGELLKFEDILSDKEAFVDKATDYIINELEKNYADGLFPEYEDNVKDGIKDINSLDWWLDATGINIVYNPYEIGPYVMGAANVSLPYKTFDEYIKTKYTESETELIASVDANQDISQLIGSTSPVIVDVTLDDDEFNGVSIIAGMESEEVCSCSFMECAYVIKRANGEVFILVSVDAMSSDYITYVYRIKDGIIEKCDQLNGAVMSGEVNTDSFGIMMTLNVFGTYGGRMRYDIDEDGKLSQQEDVFSIKPYTDLTLVKDLPVYIDDEKTVIKKGKKIRVVGTDNKDTVYFECLEDDTNGYFKYESDEEGWHKSVDGVSEYDYFENVPYAG